jgi:hypothetical protein
VSAPCAFPSRRVLFIALLAALAVGSSVWLLWPRTAITLGNVDKIREGMMLEEVETILGGPPRDDSTGPLEADMPNEEGRGDVQLFMWHEAMLGVAVGVGGRR